MRGLLRKLFLVAASASVSGTLFAALCSGFALCLGCGLLLGLALLILLGLMAVFALLSWKKILPKTTRAIATAFGSIAFCVVVVTAGQFMELWGEFTECFVNSAITAIPVFATVMCIWQLHDWRNIDKGM